MSKPDWKDAPEWAQWLAMDYYGRWEWFEDRPRLGSELWINVTDGRSDDARDDDPYWRESLERRP